jgi:hypothetical protein
MASGINHQLKDVSTWSSLLGPSAGTPNNCSKAQIETYKSIMNSSVARLTAVITSQLFCFKTYVWLLQKNYTQNLTNLWTCLTKHHTEHNRNTDEHMLDAWISVNAEPAATATIRLSVTQSYAYQNVWRNPFSTASLLSPNLSVCLLSQYCSALSKNK